MVQNYLKTYQSYEIEDIWPELVPFIEKLLKKCEEDYTIESIKKLLLNKEIQLWTSRREQLEAFILTHIAIYPNHKVCNIFMCAGNNLDWLVHLPALEQWARELGCKYIRFEGREGWERKLPNFIKTKIIMQRPL